MERVFNIPFIFCFAFISGIALKSWAEIPNQWTFYILIIGLLLILIHIFKKKPLLILAGFLILGLGLGIFMANKALVELNKLRNVNNFSQEIEIKTKVISKKDQREKYARYIIKDLDTSRGKILLLTDKYNNFKYGDILQIRGILELPQNFPDFDYQGYLAKENIYYISPFPTVDISEKAKSNIANNFNNGLYGIKTRIRKNIIKGFSPRESNFLRAILLGDKGVVDEDFRRELSRSGTSHIIAISGLHLSILAVFIFSGLLMLGFRRKHATIITIFILIFFAVFIGFKVSLIRAVLMASLALMALSSGKLFRTEQTLCYIAFTMLIFNPLLLRYDIGFQLSFLAVLGIFLLKPLFDYIFQQKLKLSQILTNMLTVTLAAQIFTLPIIMSNFRIISFIAPFVNFFVLLLVPFILGVGFSWAFLSIFVNVFWLTIFLSSLLKTVLKFISWTGNLGLAAMEIKPDSFIVFNIIYYLLLITIIYFWRRFYRENLTPLALWKKWKYEKRIK
jgi:competence protein ComEC